MSVRVVASVALLVVAIAGCGGTNADPPDAQPGGQPASTTAPASTLDVSAVTVAETTTTESATTSAPSTTAPPESTTTAAPESTTTAAPATTRAGVEDLPSGWYCRDLVAARYSYAEAVAYWISEGSPDRMDADLNGIPCETVYSESDVLTFWGDSLPTTTTMGGIEAVWWFSPMEPWEYPFPMSSDRSLYGSGCSPGTTILPDGAWFGFVVDATTTEVQFDLACLVIPDEGHPAVRNDNPSLRSIEVADGTVVHHLRMGEEAAGIRSFDEWRIHGCTTGGDACPMWLFVNDGVVTAMVEVRLYGS